jgi:hypothetical protein
MRRERTWPTSPNCGEAPDAAGPPPPKTAAWPWSPSRSRWSGWRSWTSGSMRFGRATSPGRTASRRARFPSFLPPFQAGAPALPSNTPGGVDAPSLEELMASSDRVGSYAQPEPKAATQRPCPHGPLPLAVVSDGGCTGMGEGGRHSAASSRVRQSSASRLRLPGRPPTCPMTQWLGPSGWRWRRTGDHMPARSGRFPPTRLNTNADRWSARARAWYCLGGYGGNVVMFPLRS